MESYTDHLEKIVENCFSRDSINSTEYEKLSYMISQQTLDDAHEKGTELCDSFNKKYGYMPILRPTKKMERICVKRLKNNSDTHFKVNSDFIALRIECDIPEFSNKIRDVTNFFDMTFSRNNWENDDIVTFLFGYSKEYKYIVEIQILHPFASYVFTRDSYIRDNPKLCAYGCKIVDLWNNNFYTNVKNTILKKRLKDELTQLYSLKNATVENELYEIIKNIEG